MRSKKQPRHVILGTAGHIDHGKTSLVRALTGVDTDRLKEEKARGITIDLGFAPLELGDVRVGVVDVPGHERFVRTMVAGAAGIDLVMLVVAADDGVMPQTREHLDICGLLGVKAGLVAITKSDLVEPDWLELVTEELRARLGGSFLAQAPIVPVSSTTGAGLEPLRAALLALGAAVLEKPADGLFRLPLDRVFTMHGFGTVVTGTLGAGRVRVGDEVLALPSGRAARVRGLQVHGAAADEARAGQRVAANLQGIERDALERGDTLVLPGTFEPTTCMDALLRLLPICPDPLPQRAAVLLHAGTRQVEATITLLDRAELARGAEAPAQLLLAAPMVLAPLDRFIVRGFAALPDHGTTIGGGRVIRPHTQRRRRQDPAAAALILDLARDPGPGWPARQLQAAGAAGLTAGALQTRTPLRPAELEAALGRLRSSRTVVCYDKAKAAYVHADALAALHTSLVEIARAFHAAEPLRPGIPREDLRMRAGEALPGKLFLLALQELSDSRALVSDGEHVRLPDHRPGAATSARDLSARAAQLYADAGLAPPRNAELPALLETTPAIAGEITALLCREGRLLRISPELCFDAAAIAELERRLRAYLETSGTIDAAGMKQLTGQTRKFTIPLGEYFDARKLTLRIGDTRKLR
jgi:selenocysteine-specific elongation factor